MVNTRELSEHPPLGSTAINVHCTVIVLCRVLSAVWAVDTEYRVQVTGYRLLNTEYRVQISA